MDKSLKIVMIVLAIYIVLALQFYLEKHILYIPYIFNPLVLFITSIFITLYHPKKNNLIYLIGILFYCFLSERTLNILYNYTDINLFLEIILSPFTRLFSILILFISLLIITIKSIKQNKLNLISLGLLLISIIAGLASEKFELIYIFTFSLFVLTFSINNAKIKTTARSFQNSSIVVQLFLFLILETTFFILAKSW